MRSNKYMEDLILEELQTFKRKGSIAVGAVNEYLHSVEGKVRQLIAYNIQTNFAEKLIQEGCQALDRVTIGVANLVPTTNGTGSRPLEDVTRPMITSNATPAGQWSSSDCSVKIDNERPMSSPSPDIVESNAEPMVEPSSSSASSTASLPRPPFRARMLNILKQQPQRSTLDDEFAMEIPESSKTLNANAPEFKPCDFPILGQKSGSSETLADKIVNGTAGTPHELQSQPENRSDAPEDHGSKSPLQPSGTCNLNMDKNPNVPKTMTSSSSVESFMTASATDSEQYKEEEGNARKVVNAVTGFEGLEDSSNRAKAQQTTNLAPNSYPNGAESRPSSLITKNVIHDTDQLLRDAAQVLQRQPPDNPAEDVECRPFERSTSGESTEVCHPFWAPEQVAQQREDADIAEQVEDPPSEWDAKQTLGDMAKDVRRTRVPPLWTYVLVTFSEIDSGTDKVYVQMLSDELVIDKLTAEMNGPLKETQPVTMVDIVVDLLVIAPYQDRRYRAKVVSKKSEDEIEVFFIDYGNRDVVRLKDITLLSKKLMKYCKMAIPCVVDDSLKIASSPEDLPETAYVCLAEPSERQGETLYRIMDVMPYDKENLLELPEPVAFNAHDDPGHFPYSVVVTHAESPASLWLVEALDMVVLEKIEQILQELPPEACSTKRVTKGCNVAYDGKRAMVLSCEDDCLELLLLDIGRKVANVPLSKCRRLPLRAHMIPPVAKIAPLANCRVPEDAPNLKESMKALAINKTFDMKKRNDDEVILVDPVTRKYLAKEINSRYGL